MNFGSISFELKKGEHKKSIKLFVLGDSKCSAEKAHLEEVVPSNGGQSIVARGERRKSAAKHADHEETGKARNVTHGVHDKVRHELAKQQKSLEIV